MNRTLKGILAGCSVLVVLGSAFAVLKLTEPEEEESSLDSTEDTSVLLWDLDSDSISKISIEKPQGESYSAVRYFEHTVSTDITGETEEQDVANYTLVGYEDLPLNTVSIRLLASRSPSLTAVAAIQEDAPDADLAQYGLDQPVKVTYTVDDADDVVFYIGNQSPVSDYTYLRMDGSNTVYTVSTFNVTPFLNSPADYLSTTLKEEQADDDDTIVESVRIERKDIDYDFYFVHDPYYEINSNGGMLAQHVMMEPVQCLLSPDKSSEATHGLYGLTATEVLIPHPTEADLAACGFDDPFVRVTMETDDGKTTVFLLGDTYTPDDESGDVRYYGYLEGLNCIYGFSADDTVYDDLKPMDISSRNIVDMYVWDIGRMVYQAGDLKYEFIGKGESADDFVLTLNGEDTDVERYRVLYTYLLQTAAEELIMEDIDVSGDPMVSVLIERQDGARTYDIAFYEANSMQAYIVIDGQARFRCRKTYVTTLIHNLEIYHTDEDFTMTW